MPDVQTVAGLFQEMSTAVDRTTTSAREVAEGAVKAAEIARSGGAVVERTVVSMDSNHQVVEQGAARIRDLGKLSHEISAITDKLASRSAAEAGVTLQQILSTVDHAAKSVGEIASLAAGTTQQAQSVVDAFATIASTIEANSFYMVEMGAGAATVDHAVGQIAATSQSNADATESVSAVVQQLSASAELRGQVGRFRL